MPGPPPKDPRIRQRANKSPSRAALRDTRRSVRVPPLPIRRTPKRGKKKAARIPWHPRTVAWWEAVWRSPQAAQFTPVMMADLEMLAELRDQFNVTGDSKIAAEIRMQRRDFGLTPLDMRRLEWSIEQPQAPKKKPQAPAASDPDPLFVLRAVK